MSIYVILINITKLKMERKLKNGRKWSVRGCSAETEEGEAETTEEASETPAAEEPSAAPEEPAGEEGTAAGEESQAEEEKEEDKAGGEALKEEPPAVQEETSFTARREYKAGKNSAAQKGKMLLPAGYALAS